MAVKQSVETNIIYNPVVLSYVIVKADEVIFYVQDGVVSDEIKNELEKPEWYSAHTLRFMKK